MIKRDIITLKLLIRISNMSSTFKTISHKSFVIVKIYFETQKYTIITSTDLIN